MVSIINCFVAQARFRCPNSRNRGFRKCLKHHRLSPQEFRTTARAYVNTAPCTSHVPEVPMKIPSPSCSLHVTRSQCWKQGPRLRASWEQSHTDILFCCSKQQTSTQHHCNVVIALWDVRPQTTSAGKVSPIQWTNFQNYKAILIPHWGKTKPFWRLLLPEGTQVHIWFSDLNLRACLCCTLLLKSEAAYPHQCDAQTNDCFVKRIIPGQHKHTVLGTIVVLHGAVLDTCTSVCGC